MTQHQHDEFTDYEAWEAAGKDRGYDGPHRVQGNHVYEFRHQGHVKAVWNGTDGKGHVAVESENWAPADAPYLDPDAARQPPPVESPPSKPKILRLDVPDEPPASTSLIKTDEDFDHG
jgi:hypothetical protein